MKWLRPTTVVAAIVAGLALVASPQPAAGKMVVKSSSREVPADPAPAAKVEPKDPSPEQADQIERLIEQLGAPTLAARDRAMSELAKFGAYALKLVREGQKHDDDEIAHRCRILDEMLSQDNADLFLAAKRLGMSIQELKEKLSSSDTEAMLELLQSRAVPGLTPLWATVFRQLAPRTNRYPAAQLCKSIEGAEGYGEALVLAGAALHEGPVSGHGRGLMDLIRLLPPGKARHTVLALACAGRKADPVLGGQDGDWAVSTARALRGSFVGKECLAALTPDPADPLQKDAEFDNMRAAVAFSLAPAVTEAELRQSRVLPYASMNSRTRVAYVELLARSKLSAQLEQALTAALASDSGESGVCVAARAYAAGAPAQDVIDVFDALPLSAQLAVMESWWFSPRDLKVFQPFFCKLAQGDNFALRTASARLLACCRANSSALALAKSAIKFEDTAPHMLEALRGMADLLPKAAPAEFKQFIARVDSPNLRVRPFLFDVLVESRDPAAENALKARWKREITRPETTLAVMVLARDPSTPAGAWSAGAAAAALASRTTLDNLLRAQFTLSDFVLLRRLLTMKNDEGFKLLEEVAADLDDASRMDAIIALVFAGRDGPLIDNWIARFTGAVSDPIGSGLSVPIAYSATPQGEQFRQDALKRGFAAPEFYSVISAVLAGRGGKVKLADLLPVMFEKPENLNRIGALDFMVEDPLPAPAAKILLTALIHDNQDSAQLWADPGRTLSLVRSGVDVLGVLYGDAASPSPRSPSQVMITAMLGEPERAKAIFEKFTPQKDGRDFETIEFARVWLQLVAGSRPLTVFEMQAMASPVQGALLMERAAMTGDVSALRRLLDGFGNDYGIALGGSSANFIMRSRWGSPEIVRAGPLDVGAFLPANGRRFFPRHLVAEKFSAPIEGDWRNWWSARRALAQWDSVKKTYVLETLP
ncbi:MAG: hypothetical protein IT462_09085 [Planctomycetes bacterium]|nr:hypothetical protein [Planctomycetota bacterium]